VLLEDSTASTQIGLYNALDGFASHLTALHSDLQRRLALRVAPASLDLSAAADTKLVTLKNEGQKPLSIPEITIGSHGTEGGTFRVDANFAAISACKLMPVDAADPKKGYATTIPEKSACSIQLRFEKGTPGDTEKKAAATLKIVSSLNVPGNPKSVQEVQLTGITPAKPKPAKQGEQFLNDFVPNPPDNGTAGGAGQPLSQEPITPSPTTGGGSGAATTPLGLTYLSTLTTAIGALKSGITYSPSTFQPTTQSFQVLLEKELMDKNIKAYTSTSALVLDSATAQLSEKFAGMQSESADVTNWTNACKPAAGATSPSAAVNPECASSAVSIELQSAQQLIAAYTSMFVTAADTAGSPTIVDILRGAVLSRLMRDGIPSLQLSVAAAGGSTRVNSFFLLNLFYTPKPSYNSGVIVTFELRNRVNVLLTAGARNVLYDYTKWKPRSFDPERLNQGSAECTFCNER
jgi:hypothetical protein